MELDLQGEEPLERTHDHALQPAAGAKCLSEQYTI
jgi:hypothetical protein